MGGFSMLSPQQQQQLMQAIAQQSQGGQAKPPGMPAMPQDGSGGGMQPPQVGQPQPQMPQFQTGRGTMMLPGGTASPSVPDIPQSATPPREQRNTRASGIAAIPGAVMAVKQKMQQDKVQKARQLASQYIALKQNDDPKVQQAADQLLADPKNHKIFDKAVTDPNSAEYQGVQMAYRDQQGQEAQKLQFQEMQSKVQQQQAATQAEQQRAEQEKQHARLYGKQAEEEGQLTPTKEAEIAQKDRAQKEATQRIQIQVDQRLKSVKMTTDAMLRATGMRVKALRDALGVNKDDKTVGGLAKEYTNLDAQIKVLNDESAKMQKDLSDHPVINWYTGEGQKKLAKIQANQAQAQILQQQLKLIEQKRQVMLQVGALPPETGNIGTSQEPITVSPEDVQ